MYNKLFTQILDSSVWLAPDSARLVWITLLAAMDQDGFAAFSAVGNLANRARVSLEAAREAVAMFEAPDDESGDKSNDGRRIERVPGGWLILNAQKYRDMASRALQREHTRVRNQRWRASKQESVTPRDAPVTRRDADVTPSEAEAKADTETEPRAEAPSSAVAASAPPKPAKKPKTVANRTRLPADFALPAAWAAHAASLRIADTAGEFTRFCNYHAAKGSLMADWAAAWRTWCDRSPKRAAPGALRAPALSADEAYSLPTESERLAAERARGPQGDPNGGRMDYSHLAGARAVRNVHAGADTSNVPVEGLKPGVQGTVTRR